MDGETLADSPTVCQRQPNRPVAVAPLRSPRPNCAAMSIDASARARLLVQEVLHPNEMDRFIAACVPTEADELAGVRLRTQAHLAWARTEAARSPALDLDMATRIAEALLTVLDEPDQYGHEERALLRGAADYFIDSDDNANDLTDAVGFDDDARVLNAVLEAIGRKDLVIDLG